MLTNNRVQPAVRTRLTRDGRLLAASALSFLIVWLGYNT